MSSKLFFETGGGGQCFADVYANNSFFFIDLGNLLCSWAVHLFSWSDLQKKVNLFDFKGKPQKKLFS